MDWYHNTHPLTFERFPAWGFHKQWSTAWQISVPHWFTAVVVAVFAVAPRFRWRFNLRTLLIGMTVAAIGLGWLVYANRK